MIKAVIIQPACSTCGFGGIGYPEFPDLQLLGTAGNVQDGIHLIRESRPNLVFLDVELPDGSGFEVFEATKDLPYEKIILSQETRYLFKAVRFDVADYLVKPLFPEALRTSIHKVLFSKGSTRIQKMYEQEFRKKIHLDLIVLPAMAGDHLVECSRILRLEEVEDLSEVIFDTGERIPLLKTNRQMARHLAHSGFFELNPSLLLRLRKDLDLINEEEQWFCRFPDGYMVEVPIQKVKPLRYHLADLDEECES